MQDSDTRLTLKHKELKYKDCTEKIVGNTNQENKPETSKPTGDTEGDHDNGQWETETYVHCRVIRVERAGEHRRNKLGLTRKTKQN